VRRDRDEAQAREGGADLGGRGRALPKVVIYRLWWALHCEAIEAADLRSVQSKAPPDAGGDAERERPATCFLRLRRLWHPRRAVGEELRGRGVSRGLRAAGGSDGEEYVARAPAIADVDFGLTATKRAEPMSRRDQIGAKAAAFIAGEPASLDDAAAAAAQLLARSGQPLIAGLGADVEGARAAIALAGRVGGVVEHMHSTALMRDLDCLRETGVMLTTPGEARVRADVVLLAGDALPQTWPALNERLLRPPARPNGVDVARRIIWLAPEAEATIPAFGGEIEVVAAGLGITLATNLAALRARVKGRPVAGAPIPLPTLDALAAVLKGARFGVAVWTAARLGALELEMLNGLVRDLNETTRFSTLPLAQPDNGVGVLAACGWMTGFPMRTGFGAGAPVHDPWRFDAERLVASGETDCALWISAFAAPPPAWGAAVKFIALSERATQFAEEPNVRIVVGRPGVDHDAIVHSPDAGTLVAVAASARSPAPSVAEALERIAARLEDPSARAC
jgi:formylmethanofuran dehydrogenase subunit B